jgi:hypothetical protein
MTGTTVLQVGLTVYTGDFMESKAADSVDEMALAISWE